MKKILFLVPYPNGVAPSQRFRFEQYLGFLKSQQKTFDVRPFWSDHGWSILYQPGKYVQKIWQFCLSSLRRLLLLFKLHRYDIVFIHREAFPLGPPFVEYIIAKIYRIPIIYDFDDAIWLPNTSSHNFFVAILKFHNKVKKICSWSTKVSVGNSFLAEFARNFSDSVQIIPTTIDTDFHISAVERPSKIRSVIGWTGSHSTTRYLTAMEDVFKDLLRSHEFDILIISNQRPDWNIENYHFVKWSKNEEIEQLDQIDIGIMPLEDSEWEKGKCGFKALQYMAMGKPVVASKVGVNSEIIQHGLNGYLCASSDEWGNYLLDLLEDATKRREMGKEGRKNVLAKYSVQANRAAFLGLFE